MNPLSSLATAVVLACALAAPVGAQTLEKIRSTATITLGVRDSSMPMSYLLAENQPVGFQVDICHRIVEAIRKNLGLQKIDVRYQVVTSQNRVPLVRNGSVDLECGSTTNNLARQQDVAFTLTTYIEEVRMAVRTASNIRSVKDLEGKTVVATTGTTSVQHLRRNSRAGGLKINEVLGKDHAESFLILESGKADAWVIDAGLLSATIAASKNPSEFAVVGEVLNTEPLAIMLRKDDASLKAIADDTIRELIRSGEMKTLWSKWYLEPIPPRGVRLNMAPPAALQRLWAQPNDLPMESHASPK
ncbi:amino acid ABC transporter substrate-binding protein, PAAT family [Variovorax sp. YR750]|uniref:amino acid ABC transporter substrate-binding protein n=1 Tax=Variovorax sp. YR750 TaxID=1884384 RepID=UPI0008ACE726|nr:amino acid ABC transporter substrate-binding protein [Variovorax sp. YR750]SEL33743.1 amino acid ABC transporter substrate-binding protein, PAAT family [Variovorax sp. YR750]